MIQPHGIKLVNRVVDYAKYKEEFKKSDKSKYLKLDDEQIKDLKNIARGVYSPLEGFLKKDDLRSVLDNMRLKSGIVWTIPIVLDIDMEIKNNIQEEKFIYISDKDGYVYGLIKDFEIYSYNKEEFAEKVFGTIDKNHPGVEGVYRMKDYLIGGEIEYFDNVEKLYTEYNFTPEETRKIFRNRGWNKIVAFQTRNIPHMGHEFLQREALKQVDGLFIQPVIGEKKNDDFKDEYILGSYEILVDKHLPKNKALLGILPLKMRYAGPREAIFHALIRKNYGCTHFIVGRDHAGVGDYYHPFAAQDIFKKFKENEIGMEIMKFEEVVYDNKNKVHCFVNQCDEKDKISFSGSKVREHIKNKEPIEEYLIRKDIYDFLCNGKNTLVDNMYKENNQNKGFVLWMTGLSQSGKSTIADDVYNQLKDKGCRVERLDGDIVRESLTKDLGFSKEDRDENIRRVTFLAKLLSRNGVGVIASFISPYERQREEVKRKVENYIEVYVNTPLEVCEKRDKKGLYKMAREGKIKNFTGINDPYDEPKNPDIEIRTEENDLEKCIRIVINYLEDRNYIN